MDIARELLRERYFSNLKQSTELFVGIELEFPIVHLSETAVDFQVVFSLFSELVDKLPLSIEKTDNNGQAIQLVSDENEDRILFEVGYNTLEFAFDKALTISEVDERFTSYMAVIQPFLRRHHHLLTGMGVNPFWDKNDNRPVASQRYEMLMAYLKLGDSGETQTDKHYQFGAFIQGSQIQLDVTAENMITTINAFNAIEPVKAWLFANSYLWHAQLDTLISRDVFWESSMHGIFPENVGVFPKPFSDQEDFLDYLNKTVLFTTAVSDETYYFEPIQTYDYFNHDEIPAFDLLGGDAVLTPSPHDFKAHRSYQYQDLTTRGTVEFRSSCAQPLADTFSVAAFHLGLMCELTALTDLLSDHIFYEDYGRDYQLLRRRFSARELDPDALADMLAFSGELLALASRGLEKRGFGEACYLAPLYQRIKTGENPAQKSLRLFEAGKSLSEISEMFANEKDS
ncbi:MULTISPECIES: glutamate-cysteine ligase family protein [Pseudolactococcus]|uniref:glutamate--cysteine ligase n=1 Tax=Pseudolactococcus piscium MKFS47 TaxID=297352 RepID=A0A0D6DUN6_9LACT|nr:glutamate-cysteine ligase family protein [Lactococcus piscium]MCJ1970832.1 gamma-glutamylcysteine synthetase [Lactococcus carnosus]CEN27476.1 Glutamate-cysteine ligase [Lactococcus piscium MKFS47]